MKIEFSKIKLIIWDLDNTLWDGILSEGRICLKEEIRQLLKDLTDAGIVNSICSKNEKKNTILEMKRLNILDYFIFASIDWTPKGLRIKNIINDMSLRPANVLFIDDNIEN